jgi:hypothetical protein
MEFASFLAGERWSDHPTCTHPLLGQLARQVNDSLSDGDRQRLVPLIPSVVGRTGDERTWLALPVAVAAWPLAEVPEETQRVLAAGLLCAERLCAEAGPELDATRREARAALDSVPGAVSWVERLSISTHVGARGFTARSAPTMIRAAADGIVAAEAPDAAEHLCALLETAIEAVPLSEDLTGAPEAPASWGLTDQVVEVPFE